MSANNTHENAAADLFPENPNFPGGLRVLAVDDDPVFLKTLSAMLESCKYHVTLMTNATQALALLRLNKANYDLVMTDVRMPDMDGFELLKMIRNEMDIPVIMMSVEDDIKTVMEGVLLGARDYLLKPLRILELKNIWQHVVRKMVYPEKSSLMADEIVTAGNLAVRNRRAGKEKEDVNALSENASSVKKRRFSWTQGLHRKFLEAVHQLDADKVVPKHILEMMNEPELTRAIVASHLQKFRNFLKREHEKITAEPNFNAGQKGMHEAYLNPTPASYSDYNDLLMFRESSNGSGSGSGSGMLSFHERLPNPEPSDPLWNENLLNGSLNQPSLWSQDNYNSPKISNQTQAPTPNSDLGNKPLAQPWVANPSARGLFGDYFDMSPQIPNIGAVQPGPALGFANFAGQSGHSGFPPNKLPSTEHASHPGPPGGFGIVGASDQMLDGDSTRMSHSFQHNALPGQNDGRVISTAFNGGVGSGYPADFQAMDNTNDQGEYMKLLTETMDNNLYNILASMDDDFFTEENQIGSTSAPK